MRKSSKLKPDISHDELVFIANDSDTSPEILREIYTDYFDSGEDVIYALAANPSTPPDILEDLSTYEDDTEFREAVAKNKSTSLETLKKMVNNESDYDVLELLASNENLTAELIEYLYTEFIREDSREAVRILSTLASNPKTPIDLLAEMAGSDYEDIRAEVAKNKRTPIQVLQALYSEPTSKVLIYLAKNPNIPKNIIMGLLKYPLYTAEPLASNPSVGPDVLDIIATEGSKGAKYIVSQNPNTSQETLIKLYKEHKVDERLRYLIESHPNATDEMRARHMEGHKEDVINSLEEEENLPKIDYAAKFNQGIKQKANTDLELLKRLKSYLTNV